MKRPTVKPMAIWIMEAATLKTMALRLSVVVCRTISEQELATLKMYSRRLKNQLL